MRVIHRFRQFFRRMLRTPFAAAFAFLAMVSGARGILDPNILPVHAAFHGLDYAWSAAYFLGGLLIALGSGLGRTREEAAGCALFAGGAFVEGFAFMYILYSNIATNFAQLHQTSTSYISAGTLWVFSALSIVRFVSLLRGFHLIWSRSDTS